MGGVSPAVTEEDLQRNVNKMLAELSRKPNPFPRLVALEESAGARNLIRNARGRVDQRSSVSGTLVPIDGFILDGWQNTSGIATGLLQFTGSSDQGRAFVLVTNSSARILGQTIEQADVIPGTYVLAQAGTAKGRVYNVGAVAPDFSDLPLAYELDGTSNIRVEFTNHTTGGNRTVVRPLLVRAEHWAGRFPDVSLAEDIAMCRRYFRRLGGLGSNFTLGMGSYYTTTEVHCILQFDVEMRDAPTVTPSIASAITVLVAGTTVPSTAIAAVNPTASGVRLNVTTAAKTAGFAAGLILPLTGSPYIDLSAEL